MRCAVDRIGNSSVTLREEIRTIGGELAAEAEAVLVARDLETGRSRALTEAERAALRARRERGVGERCGSPSSERGSRASRPPTRSRRRESRSSCWRPATGSAAGSGHASSRTAPSSSWAPSSSCPATTPSSPTSTASGSGCGTRACSTAIASHAAGSASTRRHAGRGLAGSARRCPGSTTGVSAAALLDEPAPRPRGARGDPGATRGLLGGDGRPRRGDGARRAGGPLGRRLPERCRRQPAGRARARRRARRRPCISRAPSSGSPGHAGERGRLGGGRRARGRPGGARRPCERRRPDRLRPAAARAASRRLRRRRATATRPSSSCRSPRRRRRAPCCRCPSGTGAGPRRAATGVQPVVNAFAGSAPALARLEVAEGPATWLASLARLRPDLALAPDDAVLVDLGRRPVGRRRVLVRGARCRRPGRPAGPFHACGEHTDDASRALMDGALASGLRAAQEIVSRAV